MCSYSGNIIAFELLKERGELFALNFRINLVLNLGKMKYSSSLKHVVAVIQIFMQLKEIGQ